MFNAEQIKTAHSKVKSGADFPTYVQDLIRLGVRYYSTSVEDGHTDYFGENNAMVSVPPKYAVLNVSSMSNGDQFRSDLKAHQEGKTDYLTFCRDCAKSGVEKWHVCMERMTCTYYDKAGNVLLVEVIPG